MSHHRLKHLVANPRAKVDANGSGRLDLEDIEAGVGTVLTESVGLPERDGEGVVFGPGDVLFGKLRPYLCKAALAYRSGVCSPELLVLRPRADLIDARFLYYLVQSKPFLAWAVASSRGVKMPRTDFEALSQFRLALPPLDQQRRITDLIDRQRSRHADALVAIERLILLTRERLGATRDIAFADPCHSARLKWFARGIAQGSSPSGEDRKVIGEEWGVLKLSAVRAGSFLPSEHKALSETPLSPLRPEAGDLLVTRSNTPKLVGDVCVVRETAARLMLPDLIYKVRLYCDRLQPRYAMHFLLSPSGRGQLEASARGTSQSMVKLRGSDILNVEIPVSDPSKQGAIVRQLDSLQEKAEELSRLATKYRLHIADRERALITAAVTGQLDPSSYRESALTE